VVIVILTPRASYALLRLLVAKIAMIKHLRTTKACIVHNIHLIQALSAFYATISGFACLTVLYFTIQTGIITGIEIIFTLYAFDKVLPLNFAVKAIWNSLRTTQTGRGFEKEAILTRITN
jgi:hypothetical protein